MKNATHCTDYFLTDDAPWRCYTSVTLLGRQLTSRRVERTENDQNTHHIALTRKQS